MDLFLFFTCIILSDCRKVFDLDDEHLMSNLVTEEKEHFTRYRLTLAEVPSFVTAEDFKVDLIGSQFLVISVEHTNIEWRIRLEKRVPGGLIFYPEFTVKLLSIEHQLGTWEVFVRVPKTFSLTSTTLKMEEL